MMTIAESYFQEGIQQGVQQGIQQTSINIAKNMLAKGLALNFIREVTGISLDMLRQLQQEEIV